MKKGLNCKLTPLPRRQRISAAGLGSRVDFHVAASALYRMIRYAHPEALHKIPSRHFMLLLPALMMCFLATPFPAMAKTSAASESGSQNLKSLESVESRLPAGNSSLSGSAKDDDKDLEKTIEKTIIGNVVFIRPNKLAVELMESEDGGEEMLIPLAKNVKVKRVKNFSQIKKGDQVQVKYVETYLEPKVVGGDIKVVKTVGTEIAFLKSAPVYVLPVQTDTEESPEIEQ